VELLTPQVEEPVFKPRILRIRLVAEHRQGQVAGRPQHLDLAEINLDEAGRHLGIFGARRAFAHLPVNADHEFRAQLLRFAEGWRIRIDHALGHAVMVAQVDEQQAAVIAYAMAPAGKPNVGAILGEGQGAAGVGAVAMHDYRVFFSRQTALRRCLTENAQRGKRDVRPSGRDLSRPAAIDCTLLSAPGELGTWVLLPRRVEFE
jgi:hypothetical protein